jgi:hypothetical protein
MPTNQLFPNELAEARIKVLQDAVASASQSGTNVSGYTAAIERARMTLGEHPRLAYQYASSSLEALAPSISPYVWLEGESAKEHNFDGVGSMAGCSGAQYLKLFESDDPPLRPYAALYTFTAPSDGNYEFWLAAAPPQHGASDLQYVVDGGLWQAVTPSLSTSPYADSIAWFKVDTVDLTRGQHTVTLQVTRSSPDTPYSAAIDALLFTKLPFAPNGSEKPPLSLPQPVAVKKPKK